VSQRKPFFKEWLEKLQQESWQLELIISGIAILGFREATKYLDDFGVSLINEDPNNNANATLFLLLMMVKTLNFGAFISLIHLLIHILTRSLWIGAIGLRYVSGDIDYDNLKYHPRFINFYKKRIGSFDRYIERLENFSSIIFSFTFLLVFIILSLFFYFLLFIAGISLIENWIPSGLLEGISTVIYMIIFLLAIIVAFDFITLGLLKRIKNNYFSAIYFWIYRFFSTITLSFLWRPMLLNFLDQPYTKRWLFLTVPYLLFLIFISSITYTSKGVYPNFKFLNESLFNKADPFFQKLIYAQSFNFRYYDDERDKLEKRSDINPIGLFSLPSNKIQGPLGEVFIKGQHGDRLLIAFKDSALVPFEEEGWNFGNSDQQIRRTQMAQNIEGIKQILQEAILLSIDDRPILSSKITCDFYNHPVGNIKGLLCFFPLDSLSVGRHHLKVGKVTGRKRENPTFIQLDTTYIQVPFIYLGGYLN